MRIEIYCFILSLPRLYQTKVVKGELVTHEDWAFVTRFCFLSLYGKFMYNVEYPVDYEIQNLLLYYDAKNQWPSVYKKRKSCREKESVLSINNRQIINLTKSHPHSGCVLHKDKGVYRCIHNRTFLSARERWWFIALSNCGSHKGLKLNYSITMINNENNIWFKHFSADQFYILPIDIPFLIIYGLLFIASCFEAQILQSRHLLHTTYKLYLASVFYEFAGLLFLCISYGLYANDGIGVPVLRLIGKLLEAISTLIFLLLLILIGKGYTVTRGRLRSITAAKIAVFMTIYVVVYAALYLYEQKFFDPGEVLYLYESPAGYGLIALRLLGWAWFVYAIIFTLIHYPEKSAFYTRLFLIYTLWFLSGPVVILISTFVVPKWMRESVINGVELSLSLLAHLFFFILTRPSAANKNFPFHVRTTQIGIDNTPPGGNNIDGFNRHPYAVSAQYNHTPDYLILFGVQNTMNRPQRIYTEPSFLNQKSPRTAAIMEPTEGTPPHSVRDV
ncbi:transmembrane protein 145-like [Centruroides vittatus]|uniref:transmembrane protein 145-like n=1 Tax=Centruroides vittatus TaxID=120091 RepID=UPI00350ED9C5